MRRCDFDHACRRALSITWTSGLARNSPSVCGASARWSGRSQSDLEQQAWTAAFLQAVAEIGLDHRPQRADRLSAGAVGNADRRSQIRRGTRRARTRRHSGLVAPDCGAVAAGDPHRADVFVSSAIRSAPASSTAWRGQAATPPVSCQYEYSISAKWLELLKQIAPSVTRAAVLRDPPTRRDRPVCRHPGRGTVAGGGGEPGQPARRR